MINNIFVFIYSVVFLFNHSFARDWCSSNTFESLLECLLEEKNHRGMEWSAILNQRIECSKKGDCTPKPWDIFDSKIRLARNYAKCMKKIAIAKESWNETELKKLVALAYRRCRKDLADNWPDSVKPPNHLIVLPRRRSWIKLTWNFKSFWRESWTSGIQLSQVQMSTSLWRLECKKKNRKVLN